MTRDGETTGWRPGPAGSAARFRHLATSLARGPIEIRARGLAMRPFLEPGDGVRLERRSPRRGDIVLVALDERMVLHRLVRLRTKTCLVRADGAVTPDAWVHRDQVLAVATARRRQGQEPVPGRWVRLDHVIARASGLATGRARKVSRSWLAYGGLP